MNNPFYIQPGNNFAPVMQGLQGIAETRQQKALQEQAAMQKQESDAKLQRIIGRIQAGDQNAAIELAALDPKASREIREVVSGYQDQDKADINNWISGLVASGYSDEYLAQDAPFDVDDKIRAMPPEQRELAARIFSAHSMDKDAYASIFGKQTDDLAEYQLARREGYQGSFVDYMKEIKGASATKIQNTVNGNQPLDKATKRKQQEKMIESRVSLARLQRIKDNFDPNFLTYVGKISKSFDRIKDKAGVKLPPEQREALKKYRRFEQSVNTEFNAYRKEITGAAAAFIELERLKNAMINTNLSPAEFEGAFNEYVTELTRSMRIRDDLVRQGLSPASEEFGEEMERLFLSGSGSAPETAIEFLKANPDKAPMFREKYGFLPEGFE